MNEQYRPLWVVDLGKTIYYRKHAETEEESQEAQELIDNFKKYIRDAPRKSPERVYRAKFFMIAKSLADGKKRRKERYTQQLTSIDNERDLKKIKLQETNKFLKYAVKGVYMGIFGMSGFLLTKGIFFMLEYNNFIDRSNIPLIENSITTGMGFLSAAGEELLRFRGHAKALEDITQKHKQDSKEATIEYSEKMKQEFEVSVAKAAEAWRESFGDADMGETDIRKLVDALYKD